MFKPSVLITSSRMPFAVDEIRKFGEAGHRVIAADSFATAPGNHSRHVVEAVVTPAPTVDPAAYVDMLIEQIDEHDVELLVPCFEEVFYLARHRQRLAEHAELLFDSLETLTRLHDKVAFTELCRELDLPVPPTHIARTRAQLDAACREFDDGYFARPAFSRGGLELFTDRGPLAGELELDDCSPSEANPWLVQPYLSGPEHCGFGIAREGRLAAHVSYIHPQTIEHAGGILFESIEAPELVSICERIVEALGFHGQLGIDCIRTNQGLIPIECNPRATAGVSLMSTSHFVAATTAEPLAGPVTTPAGQTRKIGAALLRKMIRDWRSIPAGLEALFTGGEDLYVASDDPLPGLFQILSYAHVIRYRMGRETRDERADLMAAYFHDLRWNGEPIP